MTGQFSSGPVLLDVRSSDLAILSERGREMHRVCVLAYDGMTLLDAAGPVEVFNEANADRQRYAVSLVAPQAGPVRTSSGLVLTAQAVSERRYDTLIVPGADGPPALAAHLVDMVRHLAGQSARIAAICTGSFLLAEAGLLDGLPATTHWRYVDLLQRRYPTLTVRPDEIFVQAGAVFTSAGVSAGIDLTLALIEDDYGSELTRDVARALVVFVRRPGGQSQFSARAKLPPLPPSPLRTVIDEITGNPSFDHTLASMARKAGLSVRHLGRLFKSQLGITPTHFVELSRIEAAQDLLLAGSSVAAAAANSGFGSDETMRRAFLRNLDVTPTAYRNRFTSTRT